MQPNANIPWDKEKVYKYYNAPPNNWDKTMVDQNIFAHYNREEIYATAFRIRVNYVIWYPSIFDNKWVSYK